jgi:hypothetical protein
VQDAGMFQVIKEFPFFYESIMSFSCLKRLPFEAILNLVPSPLKLHEIGINNNRPPLWSSGQSSWLLTQTSRVRFPELPDFLSSSVPGTGSTQPL